MDGLMFGKGKVDKIDNGIWGSFWADVMGSMAENGGLNGCKGKSIDLNINIAKGLSCKGLIVTPHMA